MNNANEKKWSHFIVVFLGLNRPKLFLGFCEQPSWFLSYTVLIFTYFKRRRKVNIRKICISLFCFVVFGN